MNPNRYLQSDITEDALRSKKMAFISGPRQVGKTTLGKAMISSTNNYFSWDNESFRKAWSRSADESISSRSQGIVLLDEIHKDRQWKRRLKGLYDTQGQDVPIIVTGSARLDFYRKGGDSLMGRYIPYRLHPFTVAECLKPQSPETVFQHEMKPIRSWKDLMRLGGFPEPYTVASEAKAKRWSRLRRERLIFEDVRDLRAIRDLQALRVMIDLLDDRAGSTLSINNLREDAGIAFASAYEWLGVLEALYHCFLVRPYAGKLRRTLKAEPKLYLYDQIPITNHSARLENLSALHLLKACQYWTDTAQGEFELRYLRDKEKHEVDFCVLRDGKPWMLIECKTSETNISPSLLRFSVSLGTKHNFQLIESNGYIRTYPQKKITVIDYERFFSNFV
jgi:predicted AAA+ superfamily ATPase